MNGRIRDDDVQAVRERAALVDIASDYMQLKRAGRQFRALCPFHAEKTPSFYIDPAKGLYNCHGCHEGGDVITLVRKIENLSFVEAIERLAQRAGVQLRYEQMSPADRAAAKRRMRLIDAHKAAVDMYHRLLMGTEGTAARDYLKSRHFTKPTVEGFRIGLSSSKRDALCAHLRDGGFSHEEILEAGLAVRAEGSGVIDRFRGRLMFPIFELTGDPVAFGARKLGDGDGPKYLNSAESPIYKKSSLLYALNFAKGDIVKGGRALLVEGYTDVIALHQAGIKEAVATCGTALGLEHLKVIRRFEPRNVIMSLDADEAGGIAADRTYRELYDEAQKMGVFLRVVRMPAGDDPADSVGKLGADGFRALVDEAEPLLGFVLRREADRYNTSDPDSKSRALAEGVKILARTERQELVDEYVRRLAGWIGIDANIIYYELDRLRRTGAAPKMIGESVVKRSSAQVRREREALKLAIQQPTLVKEHVADLDPVCFSIPAHQTLWLALAAGDDPTTLGDENARRAYTELAVQPPVGEVTERLVEEIFGRLKESALSRQIEELKARLQRVNPIDEPQRHETLFAELIELEKQKRRIVEGEEDRER